MNSIMEKINVFIKKETVVVVAGVLALVSCLFVTPSKEYINYIDVRVLCLLFCLMAAVAGEMKAGSFDRIFELLISKVNTFVGLFMVLVCSTFFMSMILTNDVALVTMVPFSLLIYRKLKEAFTKRKLIELLVLETIAANLGSMLTPIGNPQNLYLYSHYGISLQKFVAWTFPYAAVSFVLVSITTFIVGKLQSRSLKNTIRTVVSEDKALKMRPMIMYGVLFVICILGVMHILDYRVLLAIVIICMLCFDRDLFGEINYMLLLTFVFLFVFVGNLGQLNSVKTFLGNIMSGNEILTAILSSQFVSNVPSALLLSGFTDNSKALIIGTNIGGLGTLIASMASLITYKYFAEEIPEQRGGFLKVFTIYNLSFLCVLFVMSTIV